MPDAGRVIDPPPDSAELQLRFEDLIGLTGILAEAPSLEEAAADILRLVRRVLLADICDLWLPDDADVSLRLEAIDFGDSDVFGPFAEASSSVRFTRGEGLPGRVWESGRPHWIENASQDGNFPRANAAAEVGLQTAAAFPILLGDDCIGVIGIFSSHPLEWNGQVLELMAGIGSQIGQYVGRRRAESELRRKQQELADLVDNAPVGLHCVGPDGTILWANRTELEMLGYGPDEYIGCHIADFHVDRDVIEDILQRLQAGQELQEFEARMRSRDGSVRYVSINSNVHWVNGRFVHTRCFTRDITQRKQAEEALRESEQRNTTAFNSPAIAISEVDLEGRFLRVNEAFCRFTGYSEDELLALRYQDITHPEDVSGDAEQFGRLQSGEIDRYCLEKRYLHKDGRPVWGVLSASLVRDALGQPVYGIGVVVDVTERRVTDDAKAYLAAIVESSDDAIISKRLDGTITSWNAGAERLYGFTADEIVGTSIAQLIPEDRADELRQILSRLERGEQIPHFETRRQRKDGRIINLSLTISPIRDSHGRITGASAISRDLTEWMRTREALLQSEQRFRQLVQELPAAVYTCDAEGRVTFFNDAAAEMWGRKPEVGNDLWCGSWRIYHPDGTFLPHDKCPMALTLRHGRSYRGREIMIERPDGGRRYVMVYPEPMLDDAGSVTGAVNMLIDITKRRQTEEALQEARRLAEAASRSKSEFLANISHEIRTPMTAILGYADILGQNMTDPGNLEQVEIIRRNGKFLLEIINDVLDLSRIEAGRLEIERTAFHPDELLFEVRTLMEVRAREKELPLLLEFDGLIPETIESDPKRLRQILINLVGNAIKFTETGDVRIVVRLLESEQMLRINVIDTGIGIRHEHLNRLFEPFTQADSSVTRQYGGSGVGLAISKRLTAMLGGEITVQSTPGEGSVFTVTIDTGPLDGVSRVEARQRRSAQTDDEIDELNVNLGCRVLIVDDQRDIRHLLQRCIEEAGGDVEIAENGREALDIVHDYRQSNRRLDLILMDMQMPVMDGFEATAQLRANGFGGRIIALTANAMQGDSDRCLQVGCDDYISKPIDRRRLIEAVYRHTHSRPDNPQSDRGSGSSTDDRVVATADGNGAPSGITDSSATSRILLIEDNPTVARMMQMLLGSRGYQVCVAGTGASALDATLEFHPDVVLMDIGLPDMSGFDLLAQFRKNPHLARSTIVALSGRDEPEAREKVQQAGFHFHLVKPADIEEIEGILRARSGSMPGQKIIA